MMGRSRRAMLVAAPLISAWLAPAPSLAGVTVRFIDPRSYTDAGSPTDGSRDATLAELRVYLENLGRIFLRPDQNLRIDILNVDLAGRDEIWRRSLSEVRVMRDITPPSFKFRYVLTENGKRTRSGEDELTDLFYQMNASARGRRHGYEKALLDDWFRRNFPRTGR